MAQDTTDRITAIDYAAIPAANHPMPEPRESLALYTDKRPAAVIPGQSLREVLDRLATIDPDGAVLRLHEAATRGALDRSSLLDIAALAIACADNYI